MGTMRCGKKKGVGMGSAFEMLLNSGRVNSGQALGVWVPCVVGNDAVIKRLLMFSFIFALHGILHNLAFLKRNISDRRDVTMDTMGGKFPGQCFMRKHHKHCLFFHYYHFNQAVPLQTQADVHNSGRMFV